MSHRVFTASSPSPSFPISLNVSLLPSRRCVVIDGPTTVLSRVLWPGLSPRCVATALSCRLIAGCCPSCVVTHVAALRHHPSCHCQTCHCQCCRPSVLSPILCRPIASVATPSRCRSPCRPCRCVISLSVLLPNLLASPHRVVCSLVLFLLLYY